jgi:hypothetical protein
MTRAEHLSWCKRRAIDCLPDIDEAIASMASDLGKHEETRRDHQMTIGLMLQLRANGNLNTPLEMRKFIEGFN